MVSESTRRRNSPMRRERPLAAQGRCAGFGVATSSMARLRAFSSMSYIGSYRIVGVDDPVPSPLMWEA